MKRTVQLTVNGQPEEVEIRTHWTLLQLLRDGLQMLGTREGCGEGACGSCTVLVDGNLVRACLYLAVRADGRSVLTIEGASREEELDPVQRAFVEHGAIQCGFCTPGMVLTARVLLAENPDPSEDVIREYLSGNFCRCGGYPMIVRAIQSVARPARFQT